MLTLDPNLTISAPDAARAAGESLFTLKNYIKRDLMLFPGVEGRPGHGRPMSLWGAYEYGVLMEAQRSGLSLEVARALWLRIVMDQLVEEGREQKRGVVVLDADNDLCDLPPKNVYLQYGKNNEAPKALPEFMSANVMSDTFVVVATAIDAFSGSPTVTMTSASTGDIRSINHDFSSFFTTKEPRGVRIACQPRHGVHLLNLHPVIFNINLRLAGGGETEGDVDVSE